MNLTKHLNDMVPYLLRGYRSLNGIPRDERWRVWEYNVPKFSRIGSFQFRMGCDAHGNPRPFIRVIMSHPGHQNHSYKALYNIVREDGKLIIGYKWWRNNPTTSEEAKSYIKQTSKCDKVIANAISLLQPISPILTGDRLLRMASLDELYALKKRASAHMASMPSSAEVFFKWMEANPDK